MSKRSQKALASATIMSLVLSTVVAMPAKAAVTAGTAIGGSDRVATSVEIGKKAYATWTTSKTAVIAYAADANLVDALTVAPLAYKKSAPIFLTNSKTALEAGILDTLKAQKVDTVYIAGGLVNKDAVAKQLADAGLTVTVKALAGLNRFETAKAINTELGATTSVAVVNGDAVIDALSVAAVAAHDGMAIVLSGKDALPVGTTIAAGTKVYAIGGAGVVSDSLVSALGATRLGGASRYETNAAVLKGLDASLDFATTYIANGAGLGVDALPGSVLAAQTKSPIILTANTLDTSVSSLLSSKEGKITNVVPLGMNVSSAAISAATNGTTVTGELKVESVSAISATKIKVAFNTAPTDASKVTFTVKNGTVPMTLTASWDATKSEATLTNAANLPIGTYSVNVKNDTTDLGTSSVTISQQKIAKISINSSKLGVNSTTTTSGSTTTTTQTGYATYTVLDQYGIDITSSSLANTITFQSGAGSVTKKNGVVKITPSTGLNLLTLSSVVITGYDSNTGVSTSATLATTTQVGTLSDIQVGTALTNVDSKVLTAGDTTDVFYLPYTAYDISGNPTTNYDLVKSGLILTGTNQLTTSATSYVTATVEADPSDSTKAVIKVVATGTPVSMDMPVVITVMTWTGKTSSLNVTLKKAATLDSFALGAPAYDIAVGENKEVPFTAVDQNGAAITDFKQLDGYVTLNNAYLVENVDGTASLKVGPNSGAGFTTDGQQIVTAMTKTGKYSSLTLNIQKAAYADTLSVDSSVLINAMQVGAVQDIDFGYGYGGFIVKDQYGRTMDMTGKPGSYVVTPVVSGNVTATGNAAGAVYTEITAGAVGTGTVTFNLINTGDTHAGTTADPHTIIDSKSVTFSILSKDDVKGYTIDEVTDAVYTSTSSSAIAVATNRDSSYYANPCVYGTTSSGAKVVLAGTPIIGAYLDSSDFIVDTDLTIPVAYGDINVVAKKLADATKTGSSATLTLAIKDAISGAIKQVHTTIKSTTVAPVASTMGIYANTTINGISISGDTVTVDTALTDAGLGLTKSIARFDAAGSKANRAKVYLYAKDQYATKAIKLATFQVVESGYTGTNNGNSLFAVDANGTVTSVGGAGTYAIITGITSNGLMKTMKVVFK